MAPVYLSPMVWFGLIVVADAVSPAVAGALIAIVMLWAIVGGVELLVSGVRGAWRVPTAIRLMGDPDAWKGIRRPYWASPQANERRD